MAPNTMYINNRKLSILQNWRARYPRPAHRKIQISLPSPKIRGSKTWITIGHGHSRRPLHQPRPLPLPSRLHSQRQLLRQRGGQLSERRWTSCLAQHQSHSMIRWQQGRQCTTRWEDQGWIEMVASREGVDSTGTILTREIQEIQDPRKTKKPLQQLPQPERGVLSLSDNSL